MKADIVLVNDNIIPVDKGNSVHQALARAR